MAGQTALTIILGHHDPKCWPARRFGQFGINFTLDPIGRQQKITDHLFFPFIRPGFAVAHQFWRGCHLDDGGIPCGEAEMLDDQTRKDGWNKTLEADSLMVDG